MAASDERINPEADDAETKTPETAPESDKDTEGHSIASYEYARLHTQEKARETDEWVKKQAVRKQFKNPLDRLRGR